MPIPVEMTVLLFGVQVWPGRSIRPVPPAGAAAASRRGSFLAVPVWIILLLSSIVASPGRLTWLSLGFVFILALAGGQQLRTLLVVVVMQSVVLVRVFGGQALVVVRVILLDEGVDDVVLYGVHDEREDHHDEGDLQPRVALCPAQSPVPDLGDPGQDDEDNKDAYLHAKETDEVDDGLLQPPVDTRGVSIVTRLDRFAGLAPGCVGDEAGGDLEEDDKDGYANRGLCSSLEYQ